MAQQEKRDFYTDMWDPLNRLSYDKNLDDSVYRIALQKIVEDTKEGHCEGGGFVIIPPERCFSKNTHQHRYSPDDYSVGEYTEPELGVIGMIERSYYGTKATVAYISQTYMGVRYVHFGDSQDVFNLSCPPHILQTLERVLSRFGSVSYSQRRTHCWPSHLIGQKVHFTPREKN